MFIYAILILLPALAFTVDPPAGLEDDLFNALDGDKDGVITKSEAEAYFLTYDTDKDGEITEDEFKASVIKVNAALAGYEGPLFSLFDLDRSGKVSKADIDNAFELADISDNGKIEKSEFHTVFTIVVGSVG